MKAAIVATATALPQRYYSQEILANALRKYCQAMRLDFESSDIDTFFKNVKISGRYFALPIDSLYETPNFSNTVADAIESAVELCKGTVLTLLERAAIDPKEIAALTLASMIVAAPSMDAQLMNRIPFQQNLKRVPIVGLGCMAGAAGVARVADYLEGHPKEAAIIIATEMSSAAWQGGIQADLVEISSRMKQDPSAYNEFISTVVSAALFGDGAGAALMVGREHPLAKPGQPKVIDNRSLLIPNTEGLMGLKYINAGIRNILRNDVSEYVKVGARQLLEPFLADHNLTVDKIGRWIVHPGGPKVIQTFEETFCLSRETLSLSRKILDKVGNVSSATVLFMLDEVVQQQAPPPPGTYGLLIAMGPGFSQEAVLLQW